MSYELLEDNQSDNQNSYSESGKDLLRQGARQTSNVLTRAVGLPGDVFSLINDFIAKPASEYFTGEEGSKYEDTPLGKILPTTEKHRQNLGEITGDYLKPRNEVERFADDVVEDAIALMNPVNLAKKGIVAGSKIAKNLFKSLGANFLGETAKQVSNSEGAGTAVKAGALLTLSLFDQESAAKQVGKLYREADSNLPTGAKVNAKGLSKKIDSLENSITKQRPKGNLSPPEKFVVDQIEKIRNLITNGEISVEQAIAQKRSLNKELSTLYKEVPKFTDQKNVKNLAKKANSFLNEAIDDYGKGNKKFYKPYKQADEAFGTLAQSNFISHWIDNNVLQHPMTTGLLHVIAPATTVASAAIIPYQAVKLSYRIGKSPTLAKIYGKAVKSAVKEDAVSFNKYLKELDSYIQKEENEDRYEFID